MHELFFSEKTNYTFYDVENYLLKFEQHKLKIVNPKTFKIDGLFHSEHRYDNGLTIKLTWFTDAQTIDGKDLTIRDLLFLKNAGIIFHKGFKILSLHENNPTNATNQLFTDEEYRYLEYRTRRKMTIPDKEFDNLILAVQNFILFEEYYNNKKL